MVNTLIIIYKIILLKNVKFFKIFFKNCFWVPSLLLLFKFSNKVLESCLVILDVLYYNFHNLLNKNLLSYLKPFYLIIN